MTVEQDGEYLHEAHQIIAEELASGGPVEDELDAATAVIDGLHARGWALVSEADFDRMVGAYTLQEIRGGRVTVVADDVMATIDALEAGRAGSGPIREGRG